MIKANHDNAVIDDDNDVHYCKNFAIVLEKKNTKTFEINTNY